MASIFLSYAREDRDVAETLARILEEAGHRVWWDRRIDGGEEFAAEIESQLDDSDVVVVAWSRTSLKSRWVRDEAAVGGDKGILVPVTIDGSRPPMGFRQFHTLDLTDWKGGKRDRRTDELLHSVGRRAEGKRTGRPADQLDPSRRFPVPAGRPLWLLAAALVLAIGAAAYFMLARERPGEPQPRAAIAILPFTQASSDPELRQLAAQTRDSLAHALSQSGMPVRLLDAPSDRERSASDFVISGEVGRNADKVIATVRLDEASHGYTVFSKRFEAVRGEAGDLPDRIGAQMAGTFAWAAPLLVVETRRGSDPAIMSDLFNSLDFTNAFGTVRAYQVIQRAAARAPESPFAHLSLAFATAFALHELPRGEREQAVADARRAGEKALELAPDFGDSFGTWCFLHSETRKAECEDRLRAGKRVDADAPFLNTFLGDLLRSVGRFDESVEVISLSLSRDPYVPTKIGYMLRALEFDGDQESALELQSKALRWWPEFRGDFQWNRLLGRIARGQMEEVVELEQDEKLALDGYTSSSALAAAVASGSPTGVARACAASGDAFFKARCMLASAKVGDLDRAFAIANDLYPPRMGRTPAETERIWLDDPFGTAPLEFIVSPAAAPMRRDPRFLELAKRLGLLDYWRSGRLPDFCRKQGEPICGRLGKQA